MVPTGYGSAAVSAAGEMRSMKAAYLQAYLEEIEAVDTLV